MVQKLLKTLKSGIAGPGWSDRVAQVDKIIKFGENSFALLADTRNYTDRKMWVIIQSRVNCEAIVIMRVKPSLRQDGQFTLKASANFSVVSDYFKN